MKSVYILLLQEKSQLQQGLPNPMDLATKTFFLDLWKIQIPKKINIAMWKVYNNFMPTFDNLTKQRLNPFNIWLESVQ